ncbi:hypothetical protein AAFF_G00228870 [Aldrovandia affinis]|uniref:Uncharacterized protein n=1 Tax=Aldrovandia affinis TaxID=143900 RepID=A0AAD7SVF0_9TELE|nr:hypothetical protein AAFF_G00228870 [Aldrovandia affinis]
MGSRCGGRGGERGFACRPQAEGDACPGGAPSGGRQRAGVLARVSGHAHLEALQVSSAARERLPGETDVLPPRATAWTTSETSPSSYPAPLHVLHYMSPGRSHVDWWAPGPRSLLTVGPSAVIPYHPFQRRTQITK